MLVEPGQLFMDGVHLHLGPLVPGGQLFVLYPLLQPHEFITQRLPASHAQGRVFVHRVADRLPRSDRGLAVLARRTRVVVQASVFAHLRRESLVEIVHCSPVRVGFRRFAVSYALP